MATVVVLAGAAGGSIYDGNSPLGSPLTLFIAQLVIICTLARVLTKLFAYIKQPSVIAEVVTGIVLGPSIMGRVPGFTDTIFPESSLQVFGVVSNLGLIFFMFLIGLEVDPRLLTSNLRSSFVISISAMLAPFFLGLAVSTYIYEEVRMAEGASFFSFLMFVGVAVSITAFPVLARILTDQNLMQTRVGLIALSSAAVDDVVAWIMLAVVVSIARAEGPLTALYTFGALIAYLFFIAIFIRPILSLIARRAQSRDAMKHEVIVIILIMVFVSAWITEVIGVHAIFGAFLLGVVTPRVNGFAIRLTERIEDVVIIILLPLYFTYSGLRTNLESLDSWEGGVMTVLVILASIVGKVGGATLSARILQNSWRESLTIGILLNTKGLVELIVLNIGLDVGILTNEIFTGFVLMALFNTFITTPLVWFVWTRHMANAAPVVGKKEYPSILACISGSRADVLILHVAAAFARAQQIATGVKPQFSSVSFQEVSDRPSSYFFTVWLNSFNGSERDVGAEPKVDAAAQENPQLSTPRSGDDLLSPRAGSGGRLGSAHSGTTLLSPRLGHGRHHSDSGSSAGDYRHAVDDKEKAPLRAGGGFDKAPSGQLYSTFPVDMNEKDTRHVEQSVDLDDAATRARHMAAMLDVDIDLATRATTNLSKDLAAFANSSAANLVVVGWTRPFAALTAADGNQTTATYLLRHVHPPVAVALTKGPQTRLNARHVLLVYTFKKHEREALKLALSISADPEASVEILVARQARDNIGEGQLDADAPDGSNVGAIPTRRLDSSDGGGDGTHTPSRGRRWYNYLDVVVLSSLVFDMEDEQEEAWDETVNASGTFHAAHAGDAHARLDLSIGPGDVITPPPVDIEALDVVAGGANLESLTRLVQGLPNVRILQTQDVDGDDVWAAALKEEAKDEHRLLLAGQNRKIFLDHHHQHDHHHHQQRMTTFEEFADAVAAPLLVVYPPPSTKHLEKQKQNKRRSRRFSLPVAV